MSTRGVGGVQGVPYTPLAPPPLRKHTCLPATREETQNNPGELFVSVCDGYIIG